MDIPTYSYRCERCNLLFDVVRSIKDHVRKDTCTECGGKAEQQIVANRNLFKLSGIPESAEFNPGLGLVTKSNKHAEKIAKEKGLIPVGSERVETVNKYHDKVMSEKQKKAWEDV